MRGTREIEAGKSIKDDAVKKHLAHTVICTKECSSIL